MGAFVGGAGTLVGSIIAEGHANKRETRGDERGLRDNKLARLREAYAAVLTEVGELDVTWDWATVVLIDWMSQKPVPPEASENVRQAATGLGQAIDKARKSVLRSMAILQLETGDDDAPGMVSTEFKEMLKTISGLENVLKGKEDSEGLAHAVVQLTVQFGNNWGALGTAARMHLDSLERPVTSS